MTFVSKMHGFLAQSLPIIMPQLHGCLAHAQCATIRMNTVCHLQLGNSQVCICRARYSYNLEFCDRRVEACLCWISDSGEDTGTVLLLFMLVTWGWNLSCSSLMWPYSNNRAKCGMIMENLNLRLHLSQEDAVCVSVAPDS